MQMWAKNKKQTSCLTDYLKIERNWLRMSYHSSKMYNIESILSWVFLLVQCNRDCSFLKVRISS